MALDNTNLYYDSSEADNLNKLRVADEAVARAGYLFKDAITREELIGTMPDNGSISQKIGPGESFTIPEGYHNGTGKVYVGPLSEYTQANATAEQIASNSTAWVNGRKIVGTLDVSAVEQAGTATASDIASGKTAWVNKTKVTGTIPIISRQDKTLSAGQTYTIPYGIHGGNTVITAKSLANETIGTATADNILKDKTAWVNGVLVTGTFDLDEHIRDTLSATDAEKASVLSGKKFYSATYGYVAIGEMANNSAAPDRLLSPGETYTIAKGYYDGTTQISAKTMPDLTPGSAHAEHIFTGETAWVNGVKITGTMVDNGAFTATVAAGNRVTIPSGYHNGSGYVVGEPLSSQTQANAIAANILENKTAWVNGVKITGAMAYNQASEVVLRSGESMYIPEGYHPGTETVSAENIASQTMGNAVASDLVEGKVAWVNGVQVVGTIPVITSESIELEPEQRYVIEYGLHNGTGVIIAPTVAGLTSGTAQESDIRQDKIAWSNGRKLVGTMTDNSGLTVFLGSGEHLAIPGGYYEEGTSIVYAPDIGDLTTGSATAADIKLDKTAWVDGIQLTGTMPVRSGTTNTVIAGGTYTIPSGYHDGTTKVTGQDLASQTQADAVAEDIVSGKTAWVNGIRIYGTMQNIGLVEIALNAGESYRIPEGYHPGTGIVRANSLASQTNATASSIDIMEGKTAWVNGTLVTGTIRLDQANVSPSQVLVGRTYYSNNIHAVDTGTMPNIGSVTATLAAGESYTIAEGYHDGTGTISAQSIAQETVATAIASQILNGETAWVNGVKITGTMPNKSNNSFIDILAGVTLTIPEGYYNGTGRITTARLDSQTVGTATASDIISGATAWVNGIQVTGTLALDQATAAAANVLSGKKFYYDDPHTVVTGTMPNRGAVNITLQAGDTYTVTKGYHSGTGTVSAASLAGQTTGTATASNILEGETAWANGTQLTGTMPNNGAVTQTLQAGTTYTIPQGYHDGTGTITAESLAGQTSGSATASSILSGETAWVNGTQLTGTMTNNGAVSQTLQAGTTYTIPQGYHDGTGTITAESLAGQTTGTATASNILEGETAWANGTQLTGIMPNNGAVTQTLQAGNTYTIPEGYHDGTGTITAESLASQTIADAIASDIKINKTAWVNGNKITGSMATYAAVTTTINAGESYTVAAGYHAASTVNAASLASQTSGSATSADILSGATAWVNGVQLTGGMTNNGAITKLMQSNEVWTIPAGYHDGTGTVTAPSAGSGTDGTAIASDIKSGKTAWVNDVKLTGTMATYAAVTTTINAGGSYNVAAGYHEASTIRAADLSSQTTGTANASNILSGETAWINGTQVTGTMTDNGAVTRTLQAGTYYDIAEGYHNGSGRITAATLASQTSANAIASDIKSGKTAWVNGTQITGTMTTYASTSNTIGADETIIFEEGYWAGIEVTGTPLEDQTPGNAVAADILLNKTAWVNGESITGAMANADIVAF